MSHDSRQVGPFIALHLPDIAKTPDQLLHDTAADAEAQIAKTVSKQPVAGIFISDVETAQKCHPAVDNRHLAVIAPVEPVDSAPERRDIEGDQFDSLLGQVFEIGGGGVDTTDVIVDQQDTHTALYGRNQFCCQGRTGMVVSDDIVFQQDHAFCRTECCQQPLKKVLPIGEECHPVMPVGDRHGMRADARQKAQHPGKSFIVPERGFPRHSSPPVARLSSKQKTGQRISAPSSLHAYEQPQLSACSLV